MWHSYVYYMLGIRPVLNGLLVDPRIPSEWKGFKLTRHFRGAQYMIEVSNPKGLNMGVKSMLVDGNKIDANVIPSFGDGKTHRVEVGLGS
jgi:cellobiose phosphorylase